MPEDRRLIRFVIVNEGRSTEQPDEIRWPPTRHSAFEDWAEAADEAGALTDDEARCRAAVDYFNATRRPGESKRVFVRLGAIETPAPS